MAHKIIPAAARWDIDDRRMFDMPDLLIIFLAEIKGLNVHLYDLLGLGFFFFGEMGNGNLKFEE